MKYVDISIPESTLVQFNETAIIYYLKAQHRSQLGEDDTLMLSAPVLDMNGKDLYEGDYVTIRKHQYRDLVIPKYFGKIALRPSGWVVLNRENIGEPINTWASLPPRYIRHIGNVYENIEYEL